MLYVLNSVFLLLEREEILNGSRKQHHGPQMTVSLATQSKRKRVYVCVCVCVCVCVWMVGG